MLKKSLEKVLREAWTPEEELSWKSIHKINAREETTTPSHFSVPILSLAVISDKILMRHGFFFKHMFKKTPIFIVSDNKINPGSWAASCSWVLTEVFVINGRRKDWSFSSPECWKCRKFVFLTHAKFSRTGKNLIFAFRQRLLYHYFHLFVQVSSLLLLCTGSS